MDTDDSEKLDFLVNIYDYISIESSYHRKNIHMNL